MITITDSAVQHLREISSEHPGKSLRIYVESGGCAGLQYGMTLDEKKEGDEVIGRDGVQVLIDAESLGYIQGSTIDYAEGLSGAGFKINNPNAVRSCGCGTSFEAPEEPVEAPGETAGAKTGEHAH